MPSRNTAILNLRSDWRLMAKISVRKYATGGIGHAHVQADEMGDARGAYSLHSSFVLELLTTYMYYLEGLIIIYYPIR